MLTCGVDNCPYSFKFDSNDDCCYVYTADCAGSPKFIGDDICDDANNNKECIWDGGDCCGVNVNTEYCSFCDCLEPTTTSTTPTTTTTIATTTIAISTTTSTTTTTTSTTTTTTIKGNGHDSFCTADNLCDENEGDCDNDNQCINDLKCGTDNCPNSLEFDSDIDCCSSFSDCSGNPQFIGDTYCDDANNNEGCDWDGGDCCGDNVNNNFCTFCDCLEFKSTTTTTTTTTTRGNGHDSFCTVDNLCDENEGDCDYDNQCKNGLTCGVDNCPDSIEFDSTDDCCYVYTAADCITDWIGDNYCDDVNNNEACNWDGGDCCGDNINTDYCSVCACLDPKTTTTTSTTTTPTTTTTTTTIATSTTTTITTATANTTTTPIATTTIASKSLQLHRFPCF